MICITGKNSLLKCTLFPPYDLKPVKEYEMGLLDLMTYHSIPNVEENINNKIYFDNNLTISLPTGAYEIHEICKYIEKELKKLKPASTFELIANNSTMKSEIKCSQEIDFSKHDSIGKLLGFEGVSKLASNIWHESPNQVNIIKVDIIRVTCNIVKGSYRDGVEGHVLHEFYPSVAPGFKIIEKPNVVQYLPITKQHSIDEFYIKLEDQNGELINFQNEHINIRVKIREKS